MQNDIRKSKKGNTAYLNLGVWYEPDPGKFISLFRTLAGSTQP